MKRIPLTQGFEATIDDEDYDRVNKFKWCVYYDPKHRRTAYAIRGSWINGKSRQIRLHRFILDVTDPNIKIDHKNHNGLDCRRQNLRIATHQQNLRNRQKTTSTTSSKFKGVTSVRNVWRTQIWFGGRNHIGYFRTEIEAAKAYDKVAKQYFGEFAKTNF